jgi:hypothetical protein
VPDERDAEAAEALRGHIDAAHAAADRLVREAAERATAADRAFRERLAGVPERGWAVSGANATPAEADRPSELALALKLLEGVRDLVPAELSQQLAEAVRELLLAIRALIDWYLDRLERLPRTGDSGGDVEDIPIA